MDQEQRYKRRFSSFFDFTAVFTVKSSSVGWNRSRMHFSNSNIKFTFYLSTRFSRHEHKFLIKFNYLHFISVKYKNQLRIARPVFAKEITKYVSLSDGNCRTEDMHMNTQLSLILLLQHFKVNISFKSS